MISWTNVKVTNDKLEHFGRVGTVRSGQPYKVKGEKDGAEHVDVMIDGETELVSFKVSDLAVL
jgi:hypothetical protein